ncbi:MAG: accessory gene regulator B family protein [Candidatus Cloacimonadaceae bacterium]|jgi:polyferredoxin|nr:hypothetical protein [Candidatus Cloacimonadota bacterium]MCB5277460.1 hypothetical protein [Candidatus Cloacimonadota bacterium]MDD5316467.1 hypothetical protein [Candidatus Cloacimonadota bacterium]MDY0381922.1 hypothetical protein [Candidatus Cloacimonadaceae bacterium]
MTKRYIYRNLSILCFIACVIISRYQIYDPNLYRGLLGRVLFVASCIFVIIHNRVNNIKSPFYDPDKKKHIRNWLIYIISIIVFVIVFVYVYINYFAR